jgi:glycosyltransferase involved in cell wall biosynthesis
MKKDMIKVLYLSDSDQKFGAPRSLLFLVKELCDNYGIIPSVITMSHGFINKSLDNLSIDNHVIGNVYKHLRGSNKLKIIFNKCFPFIVRVINERNDVRAIKELEDILDIDSYDLIHTNISIISIGAKLAKKYNKPHIWHIRENMFRYNHSNSIEKDYVQFINNSDSNFIFISDFIRHKWQRIGFISKKYKVIYNGVSNIPIKQNYSCNGNVEFVCVGDIRPDKNQFEIIKAISKIPDEIRDKIRLTIVGASNHIDYITQMKQFIDIHGLNSNVIFMGYDGNANQKLEKYDVGIMPSLFEPFGRTTVEYMMAGLPVIATKAGANCEIITNNVDGYVYSLGNYCELASFMTNFVYHPELIEKMGRAGMKNATNKFSAELNAKNIYDYYTEILENN